MTQPLNVWDYERLAEDRLGPGAWSYFAGGADDERTLRWNLEAYGRWRLRPRILCDVTDVSTSTTVLGMTVALPVLVAPVAFQRMAHPDGEAATARAAASAGTVMCLSTIAEVTGSILWGVYRYRMHNLPLFVPPGHGLVYLSGVALSQTLRRHARALVGVAAAGAALWGLLGLTVLPRLDVAGALGVPLLLLFLWRSENRAAYAGVFVVVAILELYGTAIGTWRWTDALPGFGIPDGNPPSGAASGYVCFDVAALLLAPRLLALRARLPAPAPAQP